MNDRPEWFAPKRYGIGAGFPIAWQGWAVVVAFLAIVAGVAIVFGDRPVIALAIVLPAIGFLILITARTTRGGWRWRWDECD